MQSKMKKIFTVLLFSALCAGLLAGPADPKPLKYTQPDGSVILYHLNGDENLFWMTDDNGEVIEIGADGYIHPGQLPSDDSFRAASRKRAKYAASSRRFLSSFTGTRKFLVILVDYQDFSFTKTNSDYEDFFNGSGAGSTSSVKNYFSDQSDGRLIPEFGVYGPVTLSGNRADYTNIRTENGSVSQNNAYTRAALKEAIEILVGNGSLSLSDYAKSGKIDAVALIFAGHSRASGDPDGIWPFSSWTGFSVGGYTVSSYCCGPELAGQSSTNIAGIGVISHEFGHMMGLPDFYDTQRSKHGDNVAQGCLDFSLMGHGNYNNDAKTPAPFSMWEKIVCGWASESDIVPISGSGSVTIADIGQSSGNRAYSIPTDRDGEIFICEYRSKNSNVNKWGAQIPRGGLLVYHLDKSTREITQDGSTHTAVDWWNPDISSFVNNNGSHPLYYIVPSGDLTSLKCEDQQKYPFPGSQNIVSYNPVSWNNTAAYVSLSGITYNASNTSMTVKAHVRTFPIINNPRKGIYSSTSQLTLKLSPGSEGSETVSSWYLDKEKVESTEARPKVDISAGSHTIEAVLQSGKKLRLDIIAQ